MFKKLLACLLPLVTLVGCNNGGGPNPPEPSKYTLTVNCTDCTPSGNKSEYEEGASVSFTITPKDAYTLPEKKDVQVTGVTSFEYTIDSGVATFSCVMPAKAVTVTITATKQPEPEPTPQPGSDIPLNFTCEKGSVTIKYHFQNNAQVGAPNLEYSFDRQTWIPIKIEQTRQPEFIVSISSGEQSTVYFRGDNPNGFNFYTTSEIGVGYNFTFLSFRFDDSSEDLSLKVSGNVMSLLTPEGFENKFDVPRTGCFYSLFDQAKLQHEGQGFDASELMLPGVYLKDYTYQEMLNKSSIAKAPSCLPMNNAKIGCYKYMFSYAINLETAPIIELKTLADEACRFMFCGCTKLNVTKNTGATLFFTCPSKEGFDESTTSMFIGTATGQLDNAYSGVAYYYN